MPARRVVVDTNVLISRLILPESKPAQALRRIESEAVVLVSEATMYELAEVLSRAEFDPCISVDNRRKFLLQLGKIAELVPIAHLVRECRDPKDDKFLELAWNGRADLIITGDSDLLALHPWRDISILTPHQYLRRKS